MPLGTDALSVVQGGREDQPDYVLHMYQCAALGELGNVVPWWLPSTVLQHGPPLDLPLPRDDGSAGGAGVGSDSSDVGSSVQRLSCQRLKLSAEAKVTHAM